MDVYRRKNVFPRGKKMMEYDQARTDNVNYNVWSEEQYLKFKKYLGGVYYDDQIRNMDQLINQLKLAVEYATGE